MAAALLVAISLASCTASSVSPPPSSVAAPSSADSASSLPTGSAAATATSSTALATPFANPSGDTATPTDPTEAYPTDSPTPPPPTGPLPSLAPAPSGTWTSLRWIAIPGGHFPAVPALNDFYGNSTLKGWSKGYVEFMWNPRSRTLTPWVSSAGVIWHVGTALDLTAWTAAFKTYDAQYTDPGDHDQCNFQADGFQEGPATVLLRGYFVCGGGCGGPWFTSSDAMWVSGDGLAWTPLDIPKTFGSSGVGSISGGSSGYIGLGSVGGKPIAWVSSDGQAWTQAALPTAGISFTAPVAYEGGFVLPGVVLVQKGHNGWGGGMCGPGGYKNASKYQGALWWSADGTTWTRDSLNGTLGYGVDMSVTRIDDYTLVAEEITSDASGALTSDKSWVSRDGKAWTRLTGWPGLYSLVIAGRDHGLVNDWSTSPDGTDVRVLKVIDANLKLVALKQTGDLPWIDDWQIALGPTGLLVTGDGSRFWIGVPTAG
jgi:hypothetical protein